MRQTLLQQFITLFVVIDPVGLIPVFLALAGRLDDKQRMRISVKAVLVSGVLLLGFMVLGQILLNSLGIGMDSFKIAGGIILFIIALRMVLYDTHTGWGKEDGGTEGDMAIFPLAMPMIAGPASIMAVMVLSDSNRNSIPDLMATGFLVIVMLTVTWLCLRLSEPIIRLLKRDGTDILSRIMGLILAALSVENIVAGIRGLISAGMQIQV
ncbi:MAG TPA: MarC family protein [Desulfomonilia bacterium]|jgi:multiple antibiotic resistance protein